MPAEILSLSKFRKAKAKLSGNQKASENRVLFGQTKAEKFKIKSEQARAQQRMDGHALVVADPPGKIAFDE